MNIPSFSKFWGLLVILGCVSAPMALGADAIPDKVGFYRYVNAEGVKVLSHSIPPEFAQGGYEILSPAGRVIKVVPPALTADDIKAAEERRALITEYEGLARRYSAPREIDAAKARQLERLEANVAITQGNINNLKRQIDILTSKAADFERANKPVSADVLGNMGKAHAERAAAEDLLVVREKERQEVIDKFDREKDLFAKGAELARTPITRNAPGAPNPSVPSPAPARTPPL